ncbi:hypothetical protein L249_7012 [Ophiocordyceps polyrhachis-furcata BCC 54312]|uniref:Uncharacterized protein n=1 Tax=Ophiocordyceps polyrhachis-furcata BCC 54312 TaxID=1330021 RepID=A0A367LJA2_9HYPO|nr:hypothetical protein L249_7012 [Ophiocordyceps polyrhachis-furcata BCC 54312]
MAASNDASFDSLPRGPVPGVPNILSTPVMPEDHCRKNCILDVSLSHTMCRSVWLLCSCYGPDTTSIEQSVSACMNSKCNHTGPPSASDIFGAIKTFCFAEVTETTASNMAKHPADNRTPLRNSLPTPNIATDNHNSRSRSDDSLTPTIDFDSIPTPSDGVTAESNSTNPFPFSRELPGATVAGVVLCVVAVLILCAILCFFRGTIPNSMSNLRRRGGRLRRSAQEKSRARRGVSLILTGDDYAESPSSSTAEIATPSREPNHAVPRLEIPAGIAELPGCNSFAQELQATDRIIELPSPTIFPPDEKIPFDGEHERKASLSPFDDVCPPYPGTRD